MERTSIPGRGWTGRRRAPPPELARMTDILSTWNVPFHSFDADSVILRGMDTENVAPYTGTFEGESLVLRNAERRLGSTDLVHSPYTT